MANTTDSIRAVDLPRLVRLFAGEKPPPTQRRIVRRLGKVRLVRKCHPGYVAVGIKGTRTRFGQYLTWGVEIWERHAWRLHTASGIYRLECERFREAVQHEANAEMRDRPDSATPQTHSTPKSE